MGDWSNQIQRVSDPADPQRCQSNDSRGQCDKRALDGSKFCPLHGGNVAVQQAEKESLYQFRDAQYRSRLNRLNKHDELRSLNSEVGVLRIILEETFNRCVSAEDIMRHGGFMSDTIVKIEKLVVSCHKIEKSLGNLLDQNSALQFSQQIARIYQEQQAITLEKFWSLPDVARTKETMTRMFNEELVDAIIGEIAKALIKLRPTEQAFGE